MATQLKLIGASATCKESTEPTERDAIQKELNEQINISNHVKGVASDTFDISLALHKVQNATNVGKKIILLKFAAHQS